LTPDELRVVKSLQNIQADIKACHALLPLSEEERTSSDQPDGRLSAKLRRVIDKLRRVAVKSLDSRAKAKAVIVEAEGVLLHICDALEAAASKVCYFYFKKGSDSADSNLRPQWLIS
jgi:hypothetical protein